jgi:hypothetical protein
MRHWFKIDRAWVSTAAKLCSAPRRTRPSVQHGMGPGRGARVYGALIAERARNVAARVELWQFPRDFDRGAATQIAQDGLAPPDARGHLLSSTGDTLTMQLVDGRISEDAGMVVYAGGRGAFEVVRREVWPKGRVLLTLAAWPRRP